MAEHDDAVRASNPNTSGLLSAERRAKLAEQDAVMAAAHEAVSGINDGPGTYWVKMVVSTEVEAVDYADALQKGCDVVHALVMENRLGVHTVEAIKRS